MFITRITIYDYSSEELFGLVLRNITELCDSFVCYPQKRVLICNSSRNAGNDYRDILRASGLSVGHIVTELIA